MMCASELTKIYEDARARERLNQIRKHQERIQFTKEYCENVIYPEMVRKAKDGWSWLYEREFYYSSRENAIAPLIVERKRYANGKDSYRPNDECYLDYHTFIEFFTSNCFVIKTKNSSFKKYGLGTLSSIIISIHLPDNLPCN